MAEILLFNAGSSSVKWKLFDVAKKAVLANGQVERINTPQASFTIKHGETKLTTNYSDLDYPTAAKLIIKTLEEEHLLNDLVAIGHRVVAGGQAFLAATKLDEAAIAKIKQMASFAPLHNPQEVRYIELMQKMLPKTPQFAVFDSQFFTKMPAVTATYALPAALTAKYGIRKYGEHGISHEYLANKAAAMLQTPLKKLKLITLHLGSGASVCAIKDGMAYDSSMGFTPVDGLVMGTRSGDVDPSLVPFLMENEQMTAKEVLDMLNHKSGLLGVSQQSSDMRDIEAGKQKGEKNASLAYDMFVNQVVKYTGSFYAELGGADAIIFAGGIGEHQAGVRAAICSRLECLGIKIAAEKNNQLSYGDLSAPDATVKTLLIPTDEELAMFEQIIAALAK